MIARFVRNINSYPPGTGVTAPALSVRLVIKRRKRAGTAVRGEPDVTIPAQQVTTVTAMKNTFLRTNLPAGLGAS